MEASRIGEREIGGTNPSDGVCSLCSGYGITGHGDFKWGIIDRRFLSFFSRPLENPLLVKMQIRKSKSDYGHFHFIMLIIIHNFYYNLCNRLGLGLFTFYWYIRFLLFIVLSNY